MKGTCTTPQKEEGDDDMTELAIGMAKVVLAILAGIGAAAAARKLTEEE